jgi:hypothetical protein
MTIWIGKLWAIKITIHFLHCVFFCEKILEYYDAHLDVIHLEWWIYHDRGIHWAYILLLLAPYQSNPTRWSWNWKQTRGENWSQHVISSFGQRLGIEADLPIYNSPADSKTKTFKSDLSEYEETESSQKRHTIHNGCTCVNYILPTLLTSRYGHYGTNNPRLPLDTDGGAHPHRSAGRRSSHHCGKTPQTSAVPGARAKPWRRPAPPRPCVRNRRPLAKRLPALAEIAVAPSSAPHCRGRARRGPQWLAAPMVGATQCRPPASGGQHRAGPPVDPSATARWGHRPATSRHPRFGPSRLPLRQRFTPTARMEKGPGEKRKN